MSSEKYVLFNKDIAPRWLQKEILENSNGSRLKELYWDYIYKDKKLSISDIIGIRTIIMTNLITHEPFRFNFMDTKRLGMRKQIVTLPSHIHATDFAKMVGYKKIESNRRINNKTEKAYIDINYYDDDNGVWYGWETKMCL